MKAYESECCGCASELGCEGESCKYYRVPHWYCDRCGGQYKREELRVTDDGEELCEYCLAEWAMETLSEPREGD